MWLRQPRRSQQRRDSRERITSGHGEGPNVSVNPGLTARRELCQGWAMTQPLEAESTWMKVLPHRDAQEVGSILERLQELGGNLNQMRSALADAGDALATISSAHLSTDEALLQALIAAEIQAWAQAVSSRAAAVRADMVNAALPGHSLAQIAQKLKISRQAVHKAAKNSNLIAPQTLSIDRGEGNDNDN